MKIIETMKAHPVAIGAVVIGALVVVVIVSRRPAVASIQGAGYSDGTEAGSAYQIAQLEVGARNAQIAAELQLADLEYAGKIELAKIGATHGYSLAQLESSVLSQQINASQQNTALVSTLQAQVAEASLATQREITYIESHERLDTIRASTEAMVTMGREQQKTLRTQLNKQCSGFLDCLF